MIKEIPYNEYIKEVHSQLIRGVFLTTKAGDRINTMVIGWGGLTFFWNRPIFLVPVRKSRYTHELLEKSGEFTVSIPMGRDMQKALSFCGTKSGRDYDKFKECKLTAVPGRYVDVPVIGECNLHYECRVVYKQDMDPATLNEEINQRFYPNYHTFYYGEILGCYLTE